MRHAVTVRIVGTDGVTILNMWINKGKSYSKDLKDIRKNRS